MKETLADSAHLLKHNSYMTLLGLSLVVAILYFAKAVIMPIAVAVMLTFLLAPLVIRMQRIGLPRVVAIIATVIIAFSIIAATFWTISVQVVSLAEQLPGYEQTIRGKLRQISSPQPDSGALSRAGDVVESLRRELNNETTEVPPEQTQPYVEVTKPVAVEIRPAKMNFFESVSQIFGPFVGPLGTTALIAIFVVAILFQREDLRERFIRISSGGRLNIATEALDEAAKRVSRYLFMQLIVNAAYGIPIGIGLYFIGVPNAMLWGFLATLLRFIPYLGPWLAAAFPLALAFAIDPGWSKFFMALGLFLSLEIISNNIIEPWLYGVSTGTSNFALMVAAVFWTWLWGPVGLFLSTPLTVCVVVLGKYVPSLNFISVLLGSVPALKPHERLYQRMLAMDYDEMLYLSQNYLKEHSLAEYFDQLLMPALNLAEVDRHQEDLADIRYNFILQNVPELLEDLEPAEISDSEPQAPTSTSIEDENDSDRKNQSIPERPNSPVVVVPTKEGIGELSALILSSFLDAHHISSQLAAANNFASEYSRQSAAQRPALVCVSGLPPDAFMPARRLCRRLNKIDDTLLCILGVWNLDIESQELQKRIPSTVNTSVVTSVSQCLETIQTQLGLINTTPEAPAPGEAVSVKTQ